MVEPPRALLLEDAEGVEEDTSKLVFDKDATGVDLIGEYLGRGVGRLAKREEQVMGSGMTIESSEDIEIVCSRVCC
jgi:hypothetical protein